MSLDDKLHQHQVAAIKAGLAGEEAKRQSHFDQILLCAQRLRRLRKDDPNPSSSTS